MEYGDVGKRGGSARRLGGKRGRGRGLPGGRRPGAELLSAIVLRSRGRSFALGNLLAIVVANDSCHVGAGLIIGRHAAILLHPQAGPAL